MQRPAAHHALPGNAGWPVWTLVIWTLFEFGRPPTPPMGPLLLAGLLGGWWLLQRQKVLSARDLLYAVFLLDVAAGALAARNSYSAFVSARLMLTVMVGICLPMQTVLSTVTSIRVWVVAFAATAAYVGAWAATHGGYGPAGTDGHDENYVAALLGMGAGMAYFSVFAERRRALKMMLALFLVTYMAGIAMAGNPSRGGFLAMCTVALYALYRSPRKLVGVGLLVVGAIVLLLVAGDAFWKEIGSSTDYSSGTGDVRLEIWQAGLRMWRANPFLGVGAGNFKWVIGDYQTAEQFLKFGRSLGGSIIAHSMHVELVSELGTVGAVATYGLVLTTWRSLGRVTVPSYRRALGRVPEELLRLSCYADAIRAAILAVLVNGVFLSLLYYSHLWVMIAAGAAVATVHQRALVRIREADARRQAPEPLPEPPRRSAGRRGELRGGGLDGRRPSAW